MSVARVAVVGNGPVPRGLGAAIDGADCVIRFNEPAGEAESVGTRTDLLFVVNSGKSMQARLRSPAFLGSRFLLGAGRVVLPLHPAVIRAHHPRPNLLSRLKGRRADWTSAAVETIGALGPEVTVLPARFYDRACAELGIDADRRGEVFPSTGCLGLLYALAEFPEPLWRVEFAGFGFQGWKRHDWTAERAWTERAVADGRLHPLLPATAADRERSGAR